MGNNLTYMRTDKVSCPRCHETCGWCSDYRWMHGTIKLPGSRKKCTVLGYEPEGSDCPVCAGDKEVYRRVTYQRLPTPDPGK